MGQLDRITQDPGLMGGKPCVRGMRVTVGMIVGQISAGLSIDEVLPESPCLEREDITQALRYAAWRAEQPGTNNRGQTTVPRLPNQPLNHHFGAGNRRSRHVDHWHCFSPCRCFSRSLPRRETHAPSGKVALRNTFCRLRLKGACSSKYAQLQRTQNPSGKNNRNVPRRL
jgi:uncharacterized protein (DUF433 family)